MEAVVKDLACRIRYEGSEYDVSIPGFERTFKTDYDPLQSDDVKLVNKKNMTIDLGIVLREELIMACY